MKKSLYKDSLNELEEDFPETGNSNSFLRTPLGFFLLFMLAMAAITYFLFRFHII